VLKTLECEMENSSPTGVTQHCQPQTLLFHIRKLETYGEAEDGPSDLPRV
jgi:hypothetical protein